MQMWFRCVAGVADHADRLADGDSLPDRERGPDELVAVAGRYVVGVDYLDIPSASVDFRRAVDVARARLVVEPRIAFDFGDHTIGGGADDSALGRENVDAVV